MLTFGEQCRHKVRSHKPLAATGDGKRFHLGTYVGVDRQIGKYMIHDGDRIMYARNIIRVPKANKWNKDSVAQIQATPWSLHVPRDTDVVLKEKKNVEQQDLKDKITVARQVYIKASDLVEFGLTRGCPKCDHEISYGPGRTSKPHSQTCMARIMGDGLMCNSGGGVR